MVTYTVLMLTPQVKIEQTLIPQIKLMLSSQVQLILKLHVNLLLTPHMGVQPMLMGLNSAIGQLFLSVSVSQNNTADIFYGSFFMLYFEEQTNRCNQDTAGERSNTGLSHSR